MPIKYAFSDNNVFIRDIPNNQLLDKLPPKVYTLMFDPMLGFYLSLTKEFFEVPSNIFGNSSSRVDKVFNTYMNRDNGLGVLLTGDKGAGKTLLLELLANKMIENNIPVILINTAYSGDTFNSFINKLGECVLLFDEFGKTYSEGECEQESLLTLFDGIYSQRRMIILTENSEKDIDEYLLARPSRIYYHFRYKKLDTDTVKDYMNYYEFDQDVISEMLNIRSKTLNFSFDILQSLCNEYMLYKGELEDLAEDLNIGYTKDHSENFYLESVRDVFTQKTLDLCMKEGEKIFPKNGRYIAISFRESNEKDEDGDFIGQKHLSLNPYNAKVDDGVNLVFKTDKYIICLKRLQVDFPDYSMYLA